MPNYWIEKTLVKGRQDRMVGDHALGKALWSPQRDKRGADTYKNMRNVEIKDVVIHLIDNSKISGISVVKNKAIESQGVSGTDWEGPAYLIELTDYTELEKPIDRKDILNNHNRSLLLQINKESEVFFNINLDLRQGAYLTPCPIKLLEIINKAYKERSSSNLPHLEDSVNVISSDASFPGSYFDVSNLMEDIKFKSGLVFDKSLVLRFISSLITKPFVILTGLSGSGKTKLAQIFTKWICENEMQYKIIPVGADWTNREPLLGYPNALECGKYVMPESEVLNLILEAGKAENQNKPYFLILDEMNLSHVERYFADFLSAMESGESIPLHSRDHWLDDVPYQIKLPKNLFIVGTVNIDETTYMFSPKVLDRANVIEFRVSENEMDQYLKNIKPLNLEDINGQGKDMAALFVELANDKSLKPLDSENLNTTLLDFFKELKKTGAEFGYRSASEIHRFVAVANQLDPTWEMDEIIDCATMQKLLPKVHGSRRKLEPVLKTLGTLCLADGQKIEEIFNRKTEIDFNDKSISKYPVSLEKIDRMYHRLIENGFTSYAEA